ncbi:NACHT domain-containing protein [Trichoderma breve]|uniref:NACHT domain-containing protein n=1 Tax=Trichoderma breve TaxID=2034170 RepID=A0A9W9E4J1_9HYPO|nr:NACHT domain-containing protein [Trichoderma breve]KAJ4854436.1 NACHT domain-containing protein [Trichoderma breve]
MSGFEALSMVCSIMQVISFTKEVLTLCKDVYDGRPTTDRQMEENTASIQVLLDDMKRRSSHMQQQTKDEKELYAIAQKCSKAAQELQKEIQQVTKHHKPGDTLRAIIAGYKSKSHKRKISSLYEQFCQYQKTLETHILVRLCTKSDAIELQRHEDFTTLSDTMKYFISQLATGHTEMANLMARDGDQTRQHIQQSEARVKHLKYESMNSRQTELKPAHEATYVSIFESLDRDEKLDDASRIFWIQGKPGAGKSTLMKFLLQHKNTQRGVDKWSPNTLIVSHFFWKPGNILQKNLRGLLCSLIYQLLSANYDFLDHVLSEFLLVTNKDHIGDWEISELQSIFLSILLQCKRSIFFLIDGLDEATETEEILQFLDSFIGLQNIKICMSSRSEDIFLEKFSKYDGFKLHELTKDDMLQFASKLRRLLVQKAEGVYLWLILALESVKRGLRNNDEQHELHLRLSKLPSRLEELYADILLIKNQSLCEQYKKAHDSHNMQYYSWDLTPFQLMLTTNEKIKENMLNKAYHLSISEICNKCADTVKYISIRTAGLLSITQPVWEVDDDFWMDINPVSVAIKEEFSQLSEYITTSVNFIHRTVLDFFKESEVGKTILAQSKAQSTGLELGTTMLCQLRTIQQFGKLHADQILIKCNTPLHYFCSTLAQLLAENSALKNMAIMHLLNASNDLFESGLLQWDCRPKWYPRPSFDLLLINNPVVKEFMHSRVKGKGVPHATCLLRESLLTREDNCRSGLYYDDAQESILSFYGDVDSAGICLYNLPKPMNDIGTTLCANITLKFATYESIMSLAIKRNVDILADITIDTDYDEITHAFTITPTQIEHYFEQCERVEVSELSTLADEKLGICRLEDMGYQTSQLNPKY